MPAVILGNDPRINLYFPYSGSVKWPVGHCYKWQLLFRLDEDARNAVLIAGFENGEPFNVGDTISFAGCTWTVNDNNVNDANNVDLTSVDCLVNTRNFIAAVTSKPELRDLVSAGFQFFGAGGCTLFFFWNECGFVDGLEITTDNPDITLNNFPLQGSDPQLPNGFEAVYRIICTDPARTGGQELTYIAPIVICDWQRLPPIIGEDCQVRVQDIIITQDELEKLVDTTLPNCEDGIERETSDFCKEITIEYGFIIANEDGSCGVTWSDIERATPMDIFNGVYNPTVECKAFGLWMNEINQVQIPGTISLGAQHPFLTSKPSGSAICENMCDWLWLHMPRFLIDLGEPGDPDAEQYTPTPCLVVEFYDKFGNLIGGGQQSISASNWDDTLIIPTGTENISNLEDISVPDMDDVCKYYVQVVLKPQGDALPLPYSERYCYNVKHNCCCPKSIYFLDPKGGITMICMEKQEAIDCEVTMEEVCTDKGCADSFDENALGNTANYNAEVTEVRLFSAKLKKTQAALDFYTAFKTSQARYCLKEYQDIDAFTGLQTTKKAWTRFLAGAQSTRIWQKDGVVTLNTALVSANDYKTLTGV